MNLKKKLAMAMAVAAVCCSIGAPAVANAGEARACRHDWRTYVDTQTYTMHHGYSVGDDEYKDCVITTTKTTTTVQCGLCGAVDSVTTTTTDSHSSCGL